MCSCFGLTDRHKEYFFDYYFILKIFLNGIHIDARVRTHTHTHAHAHPHIYTRCVQKVLTIYQDRNEQ